MTGLGGEWLEESAGDSICLAGFTPHTYPFLAEIVERRWGHPALSHARPTVIPVAHAADLFFVLRALPDDVFPGGKWATIQHLGTLLDDVYTESYARGTNARVDAASRVSTPQGVASDGHPMSGGEGRWVAGRDRQPSPHHQSDEAHS